MGAEAHGAASSADAAAAITALARPLAAAAALDLLDVQVKGTGPRRLVRIVVDRRGGVDLEGLQRLSRQLSAELDEVDPLQGRYALEVTSPGVDHPLRTRDDFARVEGRPVLVHRDEGDGRLEQIRGTVEAAEEDALVLQVGPDRVRVPYRAVRKATQALPW